VEAATRHHLRFVEAAAGPTEGGDPAVHLGAAEREEGRRILEDRGHDTRSIAILTGATSPTREWPARYFVRLAALIRMEGNHRPLFLGQPGKRERLEEIRRLSNSKVTILPEMGIRALAGLLANCRALVCPDGGVMHLGVALGVPTLAIFGATEPRIWFPYGHLAHARLAIREAHCRPCHKDDCDDPFCLEGLSPEEVHGELGALLAATAAGAAAKP
jgi:ADP-heptose:LPS heptosyltransferase